MDFRVSSARNEVSIDIESAVGCILNAQRQSGEIPWFVGGKTDPWDHVEAAMGLSVGGHLEAAKAAYEWLADIQLENGSWYASYRKGVPLDTTQDANMSAYIAVGLLHYYLISKDIHFLSRMWNTIKRAIGFTLSLQADGGEIFWAISPQGLIDRMALLTGSCSIYMSLKCALAIAHFLNRDMPSWKTALDKLGDVIRQKPHRFNMTKSRYAMDWFYPVLCGALTGQESHERINRYWKRFVVNTQGVRCVSDRPWVTIAETAELSLALASMGNHALAHITLNWIFDRRYEDGSFWCGFTIPDGTIWPEDKLTWTNAAVLLAADALYNLTPAYRLFHHSFWSTNFRCL
ncbi:MAG: phenyltransferase domain-containing protein [Deltaproteobacteria bacterium]|nr:phenyltransferase domain-containing protein [Deltaproteobacteria bacterium]MBW1959897.1 phenyltransferase domain-containing protein [Deltaproteobacteria bacterium]MBW1993003.1 phenyltransferase domain-containing protein [Deltaproteobacteria bacterium]MBW2150411.1 phenyltransferase domain-containing protein [Deltaproteobacteria bacterium]